MPTPLNPFGNAVPNYGALDHGGTPTGSLPNYGALGPVYNVNPSPVGGQGPYGLVPGPIGIPPSNFQQTLNAVPRLGGKAPKQLGSNILSELQGEINPQALKNMQDAAARYGVTSGMPGSNAVPGTLAFNSNLRNIGLDTLAVQRQGQQDYLSALGGIGGQQINPALLAEIAQSNANLGAAPDPAQAALLQQALYQNALNSARGPGGGTNYSVGGPTGTGNYAPSNAGFGAGGVPNPTGPGSFLAPQTAPQISPFWQTGVGDDQLGYQPWSGNSLQDMFPPLESLYGGGNYDAFDPFGDLGGEGDYSQAYSNPEDYYSEFGG